MIKKLLIAIFLFSFSQSVFADGSQVFSTPGTFSFTVPTFQTMTVEVWGAGGGGSTGNYLYYWENSACGAAGSNGGLSSFGVVTANGGNGGTSNCFTWTTTTLGNIALGGMFANADSGAKGGDGTNPAINLTMENYDLWFKPGKGGDSPFGGIGSISNFWDLILQGVNFQTILPGVGGAPGGGGGGGYGGIMLGVNGNGGGAGGYAKRVYSIGQLSSGQIVSIVVGSGGTHGITDRPVTANMIADDGGAGMVKITWTSSTTTQTCTNGATNYPNCDSCPTSYIYSNGQCVQETTQCTSTSTNIVTVDVGQLLHDRGFTGGGPKGEGCNASEGWQQGVCDVAGLGNPVDYVTMPKWTNRMCQFRTGATQPNWGDPSCSSCGPVLKTVRCQSNTTTTSQCTQLCANGVTPTTKYLNYNEMQGSTYVYYDNTKPTPSYSLGTCSTPVPAEYSRVCHIIRTSSDGTQTADWTENYDTEHTIWNNQVNKNYPYSEDFSVQCYYQNSSGQKFLQSSVVGSSAKVAHSQYKQSCNTINVCNETTSGTVDIDGMCSATPKSVSTCSYTNSCGLPITGYQCPSGCTATSSAISDTSCIILNSDRSVIRPNGSVLLNWDFNNSNINPVCSIYDFTSSPSTLIPGFQNIPRHS
jgi:hypothetical protein